ncbi:E3 ubiquitin- ligase UNKL isoform X1 [Labeo rohita]|uniref:E3 ubiquitin-ligase UNKL isoform X1 n=1 Tax=Labeo rohita TaxID=84645 RepID=A0A498M885_LABRO|nr:E3 ubiquitin- ligase UNKL isoform X1 [Labeo rohita]
MPSVSKTAASASPQTEKPTHYTCPYLHRTTGDTERKYHLRYYKTGTCIHETDARGHCVKNGLHCAFAHGPHDLRPPVYDIREIQAQEALQNGQLGSGEGIPDLQPGVLASQAMIEKTLNEDPRWQDTNFVLANYKTEQCTKPPRLCRQGYACPHYHNSRDRRRNPRKFKYRSTPCPSVKHGDEWGEPSKCESGDSCQYCHSRTEQQFHPEIYKSTKCNDMRQTGYCPRGPFCAFAHVERIPSTEETMSTLLTAMQSGSQSKLGSPQYPECPVSEWSGNTNSITSSASNNGQTGNVSCSNSPTVTPGSGSNSSLSPIGPISRPKCFTNGSFCSESTTSSVSSPTSNYPKAPGFEREDQAKNQKSQSGENNQKLMDQDKQAHGSVFSVVNPLASSITSSITSSLASSIGSDSSSPTTLSTMNAKATPFYPGSNTVESVIGSALDLNFSDINVASLDKELEDQDNNGLGLTSLNGGAGGIWDFMSGSFSPSPSPVFSSLTSSTVGSSSADIGRLLRELDEAKRKIKQWEEAWHQVKQACEAWQKDAHEAKEQAKSAEAERQLAEQKREDTERKLKELQGDFDVLCRSPNTPLLRSYGELDQLPLPKLRSIQSQLRSDLDLIDGLGFRIWI